MKACIEKALSNVIALASGLKYGSIVITFNFHNGRVVSVFQEKREVQKY